MKLEGVHHVALQVRALGPMVAFYREVLGLSVVAEHSGADGKLRSVWLGLPGAFLALETVRAEAPAPAPFRNEAPGWFLLALRIAAGDRERVRAELSRAGVQVEHETRWTLYVRDPEGNRVALSHHPQPAD
jgi:catechol 2,3-dioxygenase-like lactoylglutathione lyase family enzyme